MASSLCTVTFCGSSSSFTSAKTTMYSLSPCSCSSSTNSCLKTLKLPLSSRFSQMGFCYFTPWNGLKHMGISISAKPQKIGKGGKCRGKVVYASLFGVGAPEALVIGVVALLVFGPKGLAEDVSREFKSTLEREIGLDDVPSQTRNMYESNKANFTPNSSVSSPEVSRTETMLDPNGAPSSKAYSSEDYLKITEEQLKAQQEIMSSPTESQVEPENQPQALQQDVISTSPLQIDPQSQTQAVAQKTATAAPSVQKSESES
ncbi:Sec-independent protein translocase protein TATB chloroplastic [Bienertia sinuspersici]